MSLKKRLVYEIQERKMLSRDDLALMLINERNEGKRSYTIATAERRLREAENEYPRLFRYGVDKQVLDKDDTRSAFIGWVWRPW